MKKEFYQHEDTKLVVHRGWEDVFKTWAAILVPWPWISMMDFLDLFLGIFRGIHNWLVVWNISYFP